MAKHRAAVVMVVLAGCAARSPETRIRVAFEACVKAVRAGDAARLMPHLSSRFEGPDGLEKPAARVVLERLFQSQEVGVVVLASSIQLKRPDYAQQRVHLVVTGRAGQSLLPGEVERKEYLLDWALEDGSWRIIGLRE